MGGLGQVENAGGVSDWGTGSKKEQLTFRDGRVAEQWGNTVI